MSLPRMVTWLRACRSSLCLPVLTAREKARARHFYSRMRWLSTNSSGYRVHLVFLSLPSADLAVARVADRVRRGGHHVPAEVVRRRFVLGLRYLFSIYMDVVDAWTLYDNADVESPRLIASRGIRGAPVIADAAAWNALKGR